MSRTWKWILGILAVLLVVGVAAAAFIWWHHAPLALGNRVTRVQPNAPAAPGTPGAPNSQSAPPAPYGFQPDRRYPLGGWDRHGPMTGGRAFSHFGGPFGMGFFFLGGLLHLLVPLGVLVLVAVLFYQLGKRAAVSSAASPAPPSAPPSETPQPGRKVARS